MVAGWNLLFIYLFILNIGFTSSTFPIRPDFSQNQLAAITLNTGSPKSLAPMPRPRLQVPLFAAILHSPTLFLVPYYY